MYFVKTLIKPSTLFKYEKKHRITCDLNDELSSMKLKFDNIKNNDKEYTNFKVYKYYLIAYYLQSNKGVLN